ncbi:hypothetical protein M011DRAFT_209498 [Sporormia fimetaria CBS 119925]|uniref:Uncharacterized protein n=1 Tax=Sporormia fimetaria CBS 119925 TaxID=1340428 RepID=A0A6A6UZW0_9PLEO|nr:hypothetical protein M011DRAFT_209498 [Sporormia fimetaria CBS 119925]
MAGSKQSMRCPGPLAASTPSRSLTPGREDPRGRSLGRPPSSKSPSAASRRAPSKTPSAASRRTSSRATLRPGVSSARGPRMRSSHSCVRVHLSVEIPFCGGGRAGTGSVRVLEPCLTGAS